MESSFWNFDSLLQPQSHPARDAYVIFSCQSQNLALIFPKTTWNVSGIPIKMVLKAHSDTVPAGVLKRQKRIFCTRIQLQSAHKCCMVLQNNQVDLSPRSTSLFTESSGMKHLMLPISPSSTRSKAASQIKNIELGPKDPRQGSIFTLV